MTRKNLKPELNRLLEQLTKDGSSIVDEGQLNIDCKLIWSDEPFAHIKNFSSSLKTLEKSSAWISYGGNRTGSTFVTMTLKILLDSIVDKYLIGWEGDFKSPRKFFELVRSTPRIEACILKIHHNEDFCNNLLRHNKAKAVVSIRDYPSIAGSFARMKNNPYSPFYSSKGLTDNELANFVRSQISEHKKKLELPNTLFIREDKIREKPHEAVLSIANHLDINLSNTSAHFIGEKLNVNSQRELQKKIIINSTGHDKDNFLHHDHINPANENYDNKNYELVFKYFGDQLNEDGYLRQ